MASVSLALTKLVIPKARGKIWVAWTASLKPSANTQIPPCASRCRNDKNGQIRFYYRHISVIKISPDLEHQWAVKSFAFRRDIRLAR
jgi:hypothetical protein